MFKDLLKKAGLPDIRFHDLRHSVATLLLSIGTHPKVVQELLGHGQIGMTMDTYSQVMPTMQKDTMVKLVVSPVWYLGKDPEGIISIFRGSLAADLKLTDRVS